MNEQESPTVMHDLDTYARINQVSTRTVRRWLDAGEVPGAIKVRGKWAIPAGAIRQIPPGDALAPRPPKSQPEPIVQPVTVRSVLDTQPVFLDLETASSLLGITTHAIRHDPEYFHLVRKGHKGAWVMPKYRIRQLEG